MFITLFNVIYVDLALKSAKQLLIFLATLDTEAGTGIVVYGIQQNVHRIRNI